MSQIELMVYNTLPSVGDCMFADEVNLFRSYIGDDEVCPYVHQAEAFNRIHQGDNVTMVAGTAAGKTLAVAVPLFVKLSKGLINKIMFLYPTIALMDDQKTVMEKLALLSGLQDEVGLICGGLSRTALINSLSKKILLATPDAIYWFFRKNVKYNSIMIYGLSQVDEFVLDEAHLFSGLTLQNLNLFFKRIEILQQQFLGRDLFHLHVLTATPHDELFLLNNGYRIDGRSKCGDVKVVFYNTSPYEKADDFQNLISQAVEKGFDKVLVICNGAMVAHRLFQQQAGKLKDRSAFLPQHYMQFGRVKRSDLEEGLREAGVEDELIRRLERVTIENTMYRLPQFKEVFVEVSASDIFEPLQRVLTKLKGQIMQVLYLIFKCRKDFSGKLSYDEFHYNVGRRSKALEHILETLIEDKGIHDYFGWKESLTGALNTMLEQIEEKLSVAEPIILKWPGLEGLADILDGMHETIIQEVIKRFKDDFSFGYSSIKEYKGRFPVNTDPYIYLKWLRNYFEDDLNDIKEVLLETLADDLEFRDKIEMQHVAFIKGYDYPLIIYSGSMSKPSRDGLINLFDGLDKAILISTSAVEVGVDFVADLLISEQCEAGSFLQRFGRVGRAGNMAEAWILADGGTFGDIKDKIGNSGGRISREDFTSLINQSFAHKEHIWYSLLGEASYRLINDQIGMIGTEINKRSFISKEADMLADSLNKNDIVLAYGLRSTMPSISLRDVGVTRDAFYILQFVENERLKVEDSYFEVASADIYFNELLWRKRNWRIGMNVDRMLEESQAVFLWNGTALEIISERGIGKWMYDALLSISNKFPNKCIMLAYGDVYLQRYDTGEEMGSIKDVVDKYEAPLIIPNQFYIVMPKMKDVAGLKERGLYGIDEIYYDVDYNGQSTNGKDLAMLDRIQGACMAFYIKWMKEGTLC